MSKGTDSDIWINKRKELIIIEPELILEILLRLVLSVIAGGIVGYERKKRQKEAGIRTHCMVALGSAIFAIVSKFGYIDLIYLDGASVDISRIAASVVTGVCFLGAGMIFVRSKSITGLTTAAGIWTVSAIGLTYGCGLYSIGLIATGIMIIIQYVLHKPLLALEGTSYREIVFIIDADYFDEFTVTMKQLDKNMYYSAIDRRIDKTIYVKINVHFDSKSLFNDYYAMMQKYPYIKAINS